MPITYVEGNLLESDEDVILHGCNARGAFGAGFAGGLKKVHPAAQRAYSEAHSRGGLILGSVIWAQSGDVLVGNCITQPTFGRDGRLHLSYPALRSCMAAVARAAENGVPGSRFPEGFGRVAMPAIGTGLAGGDWRRVGEIVADELGGLEIAVYTLPGQAPLPTP